VYLYLVQYRSVFPERPSLDEPAGYEEEEGGEQGHLHPVPAVAGARRAREYAGSVLLQYKQTLKGESHDFC
jgi:hypothetical protein